MLRTQDFSNPIEKFGNNNLLIGDNEVCFKYSNLFDICSKDFFKDFDRKLVICRLSNDPECLILYLALLVSGAVPLLTADNLENEKYTELLNLYKPYAEIIPLKDVSGTSDCFYDETLSKYTVNKFSGDMPIYEISDELALLLPTSGSTGSPKYVRISHKNLISNTERSVII